jgi:hypothetical protein
MNKYKFPDYSLWLIFNGVYAIEPEISLEYCNRVFSWHDNHRESSTIYELINVHLWTPEDILDTYNKVNKFYKDKFPLWSNNQLSWWVHFHIFKWDFTWLNWTTLTNTLLNLPIYWKIHNQKLYVRSTERFTNYDNYIGTNYKSSAVSYKTIYHSHKREWYMIYNKSIEFRCNNVFDARLYWYYVWIMIANKEWISLESTSDDLKTFIKIWIRDTFSWAVSDIPLPEIKWFRISDNDFSIMSINWLKIINLLIDNWLIYAARALKEYMNEIWFDYKKELLLRDNFSWEELEKPIIINSFQLFRTDTWNLAFKNKENFLSYINKQLKAKILSAWIAWSLLDISMEWIEKKYGKIFSDKLNTISEETWLIAQEQESIF